MSKRTVTMKSLLEENVRLKMRVHQLEAELGAERDTARRSLCAATKGGGLLASVAGWLKGARK